MPAYADVPDIKVPAAKRKRGTEESKQTAERVRFIFNGNTYSNDI